jgi:hypothetical protein
MNDLLNGMEKMFLWKEEKDYYRRKGLPQREQRGRRVRREEGWFGSKAQDKPEGPTPGATTRIWSGEPIRRRKRQNPHPVKRRVRHPAEKKNPRDTAKNGCATEEKPKRPI